MTQRKSTQKLLLITGLVGVGLVVILFPTLIVHGRSVGEPVRITIPEIKVNARIVSVGLDATGAMAVPQGPSDTTWLNLGPRPGEIGSAVISGHYGWKNNIPAAFDKLSQLKKGAKLSVEDSQGIVTTFVVREVRVYKENASVPEVFLSSDGLAHLNLITCGGVWSKTKKSYSNRLVVFSDKVESV